MSKYSGQAGSMTLTKIAAKKAEKKKISAITCYDATFARLIDETDIDLVLVGDSLGNVVLGHDHTLPVTLEDMLHHTRAVSRVLRKPFLVSDMPFMSYQVSAEQALINAGRLVKEGGAQAVKVEGGHHIVPQVEAIVNAGIPVMGHLGLTPQSLHATGGYKVMARESEAKVKLIEDALSLQKAGAFAVVLEMVPMSLAREVTAKLQIPTIGIGAGPDTDGQIIVLHDILGFEESFNPKFLKKYANLGKDIREAVSAYDRDVKSSEFPTLEHSFKD